MRWAYIFMGTGIVLAIIVLFRAAIVFDGLALVSFLCVGIGLVFAYVGMRGSDEHH